MSALQKYKKEASQLKEENERLKEEVERLKMGLPIKSEMSSSSLEEDPDKFLERSKEMVKDLRHLLQSEFSIGVAASKIECALVEAYDLGRKQAIKEDAIDNLLKQT
jgi:predicted RNase H-like nuclease (RuvC/YqgF family)